MDVVICSNGVDSIIASEICTPYSEMVNLHVQCKVEYNMEFRAVNQDQVMYSCVDWRNQSDKSRALCAVIEISSQRQNGEQFVPGLGLLIGISVKITLPLNGSEPSRGIKFKINSCKKEINHPCFVLERSGMLRSY
jgi:hypothetical protein